MGGVQPINTILGGRARSPEVNIYEDIIEICTSIGMNIIVAVGFWLNWKDERTKKVSRDD
jgi:hypothetical protein